MDYDQWLRAYCLTDNFQTKHGSLLKDTFFPQFSTLTGRLHCNLCVPIKFISPRWVGWLCIIYSPNDQLAFVPCLGGLACDSVFYKLSLTPRSLVVIIYSPGERPVNVWMSFTHRLCSILLLLVSTTSQCMMWEHLFSALTMWPK